MEELESKVNLYQIVSLHVKRPRSSFKNEIQKNSQHEWNQAWDSAGYGPFNFYYNRQEREVLSSHH